MRIKVEEFLKQEEEREIERQIVLEQKRIENQEINEQFNLDYEWMNDNAGDRI